jgi:8-oxo-dGTP diphosphatase
MNTILVAVKGILIKNNKMLIVRRSPFSSTGAGNWENVGGALEFGETFETALKREFHEEVQLHVTVKELLYATTFFSKENRQIVLLSFLCECDNDDVILSDEHDQFLWATKDELVQLLPDTILSNYKQHSILDLF